MPLKIPIKLKKLVATDSETAASAWFLPGISADDWIPEITNSSVDQKTLRLCSLKNPEGVIAWFGGGTVLKEPSKRGFGLKLIHDKLLIPCDCELSISVSNEEISQLIAGDLGVLLPGNRWYAFSTSDSKKLHECIAPFEEKQTEWNRAVVPEQDLPRLESIRAELPDIEQTMTQWRDDIGTSDPNELPEIPGQENMGRRGIRESLLEGILRATGRAPEREGVGETWVNRVENWAANQLNRISNQQRNELDRLIDLMKRDPDKGLKFALPLSNENMGRGMAPPGGSLTRRNVNFSLGSIFGSGGEISPWMVENDHYHELLKSYREAANRELNLGRFRRAAYIFAELLGDMSSAANALEQGKHFAEAAVIYEKKIKDKVSAAKVFRKAGMFEESLRLYRDLAACEEMARLLRKLGREEEAADAFHEAIAHLLLKDRLIEAAQIAKDDLDDGQQALTIYRKGWPSNPRSGECLRKEIELLARKDEHDQVSERVQQLAGEKWSPKVTAELVRQLVHVRKNYPVRDLAEMAGDYAKVVAGNHLADSKTRQSSILNLLPELDSSDRLLNRDVKRFGKQKAKIPSIKPAAPGITRDQSVSLIFKYERSPHPPKSRSVAACGIDGQAIVVSLSDNQETLHIVATTKERGILGAVTKEIPRRPGREIRLYPTNDLFLPGKHSLVLKCGKHSRIPFEPLLPDIEVGTTAPIDDALGIFSSESGQTWKILKNNGELFMEGSHLGNINQTEHLVTIPPEITREIPYVPGVCWRNQVYFGLGNHLCRWDRGELSILQLPHQIVDLAASSDRTRSRVAVGMTHGFAVVWGDIDLQNPDIINYELFEEPIEHPKVAFIKSQHLVIADRNGVNLLSASKDKVTRHDHYAFKKKSSILAIVPLQTASEFEVVTADTIVGMGALK